jgi:hypothetical protein
LGGDGEDGWLVWDLVRGSGEKKDETEKPIRGADVMKG